MPRSSTIGYWRQYGSGKKDTTPGVYPTSLKLSFDPTAASASTGVTLPKGARVIGVQSLGGATGGTNPTVDVGTAGDADGFANELDADDVTIAPGVGALTGTVLSADTLVYAGVGASAATGGTTVAYLTYVMDDDGSE